MPVEWEEYRPVAGEAYSPGTEYQVPSGMWFELDWEIPHVKEDDEYKFRRPKPASGNFDLQELKEGAEDLAESLRRLAYAVEQTNKQLSRVQSLAKSHSLGLESP